MGWGGGRGRGAGRRRQRNAQRIGGGSGGSPAQAHASQRSLTRLAGLIQHQVQPSSKLLIEGGCGWWRASTWAWGQCHWGQGSSRRDANSWCQQRATAGTAAGGLGSLGEVMSVAPPSSAAAKKRTTRRPSWEALENMARTASCSGVGWRHQSARSGRAAGRLSAAASVALPGPTHLPTAEAGGGVSVGAHVQQAPAGRVGGEHDKWGRMPTGGLCTQSEEREHSSFPQGCRLTHSSL